MPCSMLQVWVDLGTLRSGQCFGESTCTASRYYRTHHAVADTLVELLVLSKADLKGELRGYLAGLWKDGAAGASRGGGASSSTGGAEGEEGPSVTTMDDLLVRWVRGGGRRTTCWSGGRGGFCE